MTYSCRFIFVHFNAWEYVGSDLLWAGIVTNLASAIEAEFGVMTSRIFRLLNVDVIQDDASSNKRTLLVDVPADQNDDQTNQKLKDVLTEYGVVKVLKPFKNQNEDENHRQWLVEYSNYEEAADAYENMKSNRIKVTLHCSTEKDFKKESCPLFCHFRKHFVKHPKTTLCLPNLCWLLLFCLAFFCLVVVASQVAKAFDLDIYRVSLNTARNVVFIQREF